MQKITVNKHTLMIRYLLCSTLYFSDSLLPLPPRFPSLSGIMGTERAGELCFPTFLNLKGQSALWALEKLKMCDSHFCENLSQIKQIRFVFYINKMNGLQPAMWGQAVCWLLTYHLLVLGLKFPLTLVNLFHALCPELFLPGMFHQRRPWVSKPSALRRRRKYHMEVCFQSCRWWWKIARTTWNRCFVLFLRTKIVCWYWQEA